MYFFFSFSNFSTQVSVESRTPSRLELDGADAIQEVAAQDGNGVTANDSKEKENSKLPQEQQQQQPAAVNMSGGENSADAIQTIGTGGGGGTNGGRLDSSGSGGSGPKTTSAVTTLVSNGSTVQNNSNVTGATNLNNNSEVSKQNNRNRNTISDEEDIEEPSPIAGVTPRGFWGVYDRPSSRGGSPTGMDNMSEVSSQPPVQPMLPRSKSRSDMIGTGGTASGAMPVTASAIGGSTSNLTASGRISNQLSFWKARCITFYRNGDPFFNGLEFRFKPGRDISNLERLLDKISTRMDLPRGARYIFSMDGDRKYSLDELEDGSSYVVSSYKQFKVSRLGFNCFFIFLPLIFIILTK